MTRALAIALALAPAIAVADDEEPAQQPPDDPRMSSLDARQEELSRKLLDLENKLHRQDDLSRRLENLARTISAYLDVGAFAVAGDGTGIRSDVFHRYYPQYRDTIAGEWVFMGDPFSTAINSLGEPADTGQSREIRTDSINSAGRPSVLVNSIGLQIHKDFAVGDRPTAFGMDALALLLPRPGPDVVEVAYAFATWRPLREAEVLLISAGKIDPVLGVEYRAQDATKRIGITPSLIARYTTGRPFGVSARYIRDAWNLSAAITNGDNFEERFEAHDELRANRVPMVSGHVQRMLPIGKGLEVGVSGAYGPQDGQKSLDTRQWHYGVDVKLVELNRWRATAEFVQGKQQGRSDAMSGIACDLAPCLRYKGAYVVVDRIVNTRWVPYVRFDWRDAVHRSGADFVYESHTIRSTIGVNYAFADRVHGKLEYTLNKELGVPAFPHDVVAASLVLRTE